MVSMSLFSVKEQTTEVHTQAGWILELHLLPAAPGHLGTACLPAQSSYPRRCPFCLLFTAGSCHFPCLFHRSPSSQSQPGTGWVQF